VLSRDEFILQGIVPLNPQDYVMAMTSKIDFSSIVPSHDFDEMVFAYFNPRLLATAENDDTKYKSQSIAELKDSIRTHGLQQNLIVNKVENDYYLLDGHRRFEAIRQLMSENILCFHEERKSWVKANELFSQIEVTVHNNLSTQDAFSKVFCIDNNKITFEEHILIKFIDFCQKCSISKQTIAKIVHKQVPYVESVLSLLSKVKNDEHLQEELFAGKIEMSAALELLENYENSDDRKEVMEKAWELAEERIQKTIKKLDDGILTAVVKFNKAKQAKQDLVSAGKFEEIPDVDDAISKHMDEMEERKDQRRKASTSGITKTDLQSAKTAVNKKNGITETPEPVTEAKPKSINKKFASWQNAVRQIINSGNCLKSGDYVPPLINMFLDNFLTTIQSDADAETEIDAFIEAWAPQFMENGLDTNAGDDSIKEQSDSKKSPFDDDDTDLTNIPKTETKEEEESDID
jgi:hypothetical protein